MITGFKLVKIICLHSLTRLLLIIIAWMVLNTEASAGQLKAGVGREDITSEVALKNDTLYVKALVLQDAAATAVIITVDAVAIEEIGSIKKTYLSTVREQLKKEFNILPLNVMVNASHCHGIVCEDVEERTVKAVREAMKNLVEVDVGTGVGFENRIMENRRVKLKNGKDADMRRAYSLPPDSEVESVGPVDPQIGILRLDQKNGKTLAVLYNFACHPIQGVPGGGNTADLTGFSSKVIEDCLGDGAMAFFIQGCGGDINPVLYKDVAYPPDAEPLGNMLGISTMRGLKQIKCKPDVAFKVINETISLPRAELSGRIESLQAEQQKLLQSLGANNLNFKTFLPLMVKYNNSEEFPSYFSQHYLHEKMLGRNDLDKLDAENRKNMKKYLANIHVMEELTRVQTNLALLKKNQAKNIASGKRTIDVEVMGLRIGDFVMVTFPGELTVQIGLNIKKMSPHKSTFVAGYTNGYIYYAPTAEQLKNVGNAQEDSDCILAPEWQQIFEDKVATILKKL